MEIHKLYEEVGCAGMNQPRFHFHSLRHTFASWLVQDGVSLYEVQKLTCLLKRVPEQDTLLIEQLNR